VFPEQIVSHKLSSLCLSRDNNFNLLRLILSIGVVFTHSYLLLDGNMINDPVNKLLNINWGDLGYVTFFFIISGFVMAQSLFENKNIFSFIKNRFLRIFPAVFTANVFIILVCAFFVSIPFLNYFSKPDTLYFIYKNTILITDIRPRLGFNLFENNPYPHVLNAQWWTLPWNIKMYAGLVLLFGSVKQLSTPLFFNIIFVIISVVSFYFRIELGWWDNISLCFLAGIFFYVNKEYISLNYIYLSIVIAFYLIFCRTRFDELVSPILKGYMIFYFVFVFKKTHTLSKRLRDYSFGIFLYHLFIQQILVHFGVENKYFLFVSSLLLSLILAMLFVHFIESKMVNSRFAKKNSNNNSFTNHINVK